jgi:hypothetical protein
MTYTFIPEPNIIHIATLVVLIFVKGCVYLSFEKKKLKTICYPHYLLASPKNIGEHNSIPEYAPTASILKPFEKMFLKKWFSPQITSKPPKRWSKKKKEEEKEKLQESPQIKRKLIFWEEKNNSTSKILFDVIPFSPPPSYHFKNPFQNH